MKCSTFARVSVFVIIFLVIFNFGLLARTYHDPQAFFSFHVPRHWVFQVSESDPQLSVFYGANLEELVYVEHLGSVSDVDSESFASRIMEEYGSIYGLKEFAVIEPIQRRELDGFPGAVMIYEFKGTITRMEQRIFVVINTQGYTITYSDASCSFWDNVVAFDLFLDSWRWLE